MTTRSAWLLLLAWFCLGCGSEGGGPAVSGDQGAERDGAGAATGSPCKSSPDCEGLVCLTSVVDFGHTVAFPDGYCSRKCKNDLDCVGKDVCRSFMDAAGNPVAMYCLQACPGGGCRAGYSCTSAGLCYPK